MKIKTIAFFTLAITSTAVAQDHDKPKDELKIRRSSRPILAKTEGSEFSIDPNLVDKMFESTTTKENQAQVVSTRPVRAEVGYGHMVLSNLTLKNKYFEVPYSKNVSALPYGFIQGSKSLFTFGSGSFNTYGMIGYSNQQGVYDVTGSSGIALKDTVTMQWVPLEIGVSTDVKLFSGNVQPALIAGLGADWITQTGELDGMNQNFWIPHASAGPAITFFGSGDNAPGFDGITIASIYRTSNGGDQTFKGWSFNLTSRFAM